jgi:DNA-binding SARP family transcriptional activator/ABC-type transport system substrate-binding protein/sugar lactone lactonase YvrE
VDLQLLGPVEVRLDDRAIELGPRKQRAVLAMLALSAGRTVSADRLVEGLWGESPPSSAPKMVQLYVSHLRRVLNGDGVRIVTRDRGYELQVSNSDVDAIRFEQLLGDSRAREALALWRGDALADLVGEPFAAGEIRRLDELRLTAAERAIDDDLAAGRHADVIGELEALVAAEPLREHLHAQHMLALYRSGRQSDALAAYRDARSGLVEQIGVEPGGELRRLQDAILAQDPALDVPVAPEAEPVTSPRPPPRGPPLRVLVTAAILVVAGLTAFGVLRVLEPHGLSGIGENAVGLIDPDSGLITARYGVGQSPGAVVGGGGSVWIANSADGTVSRIDRGRDQPVNVIPVGESPAALAFGEGSLWVADSASRKVWQVDPGSNKVVQSIEVGNAPRALAAAAGALWVASGVDGRIQRIDLDGGRVARRPVLVGANPSAIAAGAGALWVASEEAGSVTRIEPRTGRVAARIPVGNGASALAVGEGAVWVLNRRDGTLWRIDPATNSPSWAGSVGRDPTAVAVGGGSVWVAGGEEGTVRRVDPHGPRVVKRLEVGSSPAGIAVVGGSVWAVAGAPQAAHRGGTLRVFVPHAPQASIPMDWLDWHSYTTWATFSLSSLAYDGLVAYRRVEGAAGDTLVGALATTAPAPSPDGKTYVFTLRPGLRYSDGRPVRPTDFRTSMERFLEVVGRSPAEAFPSHYEGIVGARRCMQSKAPCDLSRGIEADSRERTITVHLTRRDAQFLHKLTMSFAFLVPADSPARPTTGRPPPGTGPYRVTAWDAKRGGTLVRNPYFLSGPARARGDGFVDRIEVRLHESRRVEPGIAAVQRGDADVAVLADNFGSLVSEDRLQALLTLAPGRVHSSPAANTDWIFLNVRRRPFDDISVRQAVNLAIDRAKVVELAGGPEVGQLICQVVPAGFSGYEPYCPYTATPTKGGAWTAPDIERARRLVVASGRAGEHVVVRVPDFREAVGRYYARLLEQLGFRTTLRVQSFADDDVYDPQVRAQTGFVGWGADYLAASTFIETTFTCATRRTLNLSRLCDQRLERQINRAGAMAPADAAGAWATAAHRLTDLAAAVPLTRRRAVVLVSERAGNVKYHGQWSTLLDQIWVR